MPRYTLEYLHINGFRPPVFNKTLFDNLVLKESTKEMIKNLTEMYIRDSAIQSSQEESQYAIDITKILQPAKPVQKQATWSADYVQGKGDCLIFLFHGKPGVGKTYTAGEYSRNEKQDQDMRKDTRRSRRRV